MAKIGEIELPAIYVRAFQQPSLDVQATLSVEDMRHFGEAGRNFIAADETWWHIEGLADVTCWILGFIPFTLLDVKVERDVMLPGMAGFSQAVNPVSLRSLDRAMGEYNTLHLAAAVNLQNPSFIAAAVASPMEFKVYIKEQQFGLARISNCSLAPGLNVVTLEFRLEKSPYNIGAIQDFISGYIRSEMQLVTVIGFSESTSDPFLSAIVDKLNATVSFQPMPTTFISDLAAQVSPLSGLTANARVYNPLPQAITLGQLDLRIFLPEVPRREIFELNTAQAQTYIPGAVLQPNQTTFLHIGMSILGARITNPMTLKKLIEDLDQGAVTVAVEGLVSVKIMPAFELSILYRADSMTAKLSWCILCV